MIAVEVRELHRVKLVLFVDRSVSVLIVVVFNVILEKVNIMPVLDKGILEAGEGDNLALRRGDQCQSYSAREAPPTQYATHSQGTATGVISAGLMAP